MLFHTEPLQTLKNYKFMKIFSAIFLWLIFFWLPNNAQGGRVLLVDGSPLLNQEIPDKVSLEIL